MEENNQIRLGNRLKQTVNSPGNQSAVNRTLEQSIKSVSNHGLGHLGPAPLYLQEINSKSKKAPLIKTQERGAAQQALQLSQQVQENTMNQIQAQIQRIQQQVELQKEQARKAKEEQNHREQTISIAKIQQISPRGIKATRAGTIDNSHINNEFQNQSSHSTQIKNHLSPAQIQKRKEQDEFNQAFERSLNEAKKESSNQLQYHVTDYSFNEQGQKVLKTGKSSFQQLPQQQMSPQSSRRKEQGKNNLWLDKDNAYADHTKAINRRHRDQMPAQQSASATQDEDEDIENQKEVPRQSVLSQGIEKSEMSNFEDQSSKNHSSPYKKNRDKQNINEYGQTVKEPPSAIMKDAFNNSQEQITQRQESDEEEKSMQIRGVETIEEFFRPEFAQNTQSLDDLKGIASSDEDGEKIQKFTKFSDESNSDDEANGELNLGEDGVKNKFRNMGFPNMNYLDPETNGPPVQNQSYYRNYENNKDNDVKKQREGFINARDNMPNNTFIKLFQNQNKEEEEDSANTNRSKAKSRVVDSRDKGASGKQDEMQSIQYIDQNYVESSEDKDEQSSRLGSSHQLKIVYNPAKKKSRSLAKVGLDSKDPRGLQPEPLTNSNKVFRRRRESFDVLEGTYQPGRRVRPKASSQDKLPPLQVTHNKKVQNLIHESDQKNQYSRKQLKEFGSQASAFLNQAINGELVPVSFETMSKKRENVIYKTIEDERREKPLVPTQVNISQTPQILENSKSLSRKLNSNSSLKKEREVSSHMPVADQLATIQKQKKTNQSLSNQQLSSVKVSNYLQQQQLQNDQQSPLKAQLPPILKQQSEYLHNNAGQLQKMHKRIDNPYNILTSNQRNFSSIQPSMQVRSSPMPAMGRDPNMPNGMPLVTPFKTLAQANKDLNVGPIKAFPTPQNATGNMLDDIKGQVEETDIEDQLKSGERDMKMFVQKFEDATRTGNSHQQILYLKRIRLHHKVIRQVSFNAFKMMIDVSTIQKLKKGQRLYRMNEQIESLYFVLYGALTVKYTNQPILSGTASGGVVGDTVRGGNVLGEEGFFCHNPLYKETVVAESEECGVLVVEAHEVANLGLETFQGKGINQLGYQQDFKKLFEILNKVHLTKEEWRGRAAGFLAQKAVKDAETNADNFTEFKTSPRDERKQSNKMATHGQGKKGKMKRPHNLNKQQ